MGSTTAALQYRCYRILKKHQYEIRTYAFAYYLLLRYFFLRDLYLYVSGGQHWYDTRRIRDRRSWLRTKKKKKQLFHVLFVLCTR